MAKRTPLLLEKLDSRQLLAVDFHLLKDIETKPANTPDIAVLGALGNEVAFAFTAQDPLRFRDQLWEVPADESGPAHPFHDAGNLATVGTNKLVAVNGRYLFNRYSNLPEQDGLWSSDGTTAGSFRLGPSSTDSPTVASGKAYYFVKQFAGVSLWVTDGTVAGTHEIAEDRDEQDFHFDSPLASDGQHAYLVVKDHLSIRHLATLDSSNKITPILEFPQGSTGQLEFTAAGNLLVTNNPALSGPSTELYSYAPSRGLVLISNKVGGVANLPTLQISGGRAFFVSDSFSLWTTDGTRTGTTRLLDDSYRFSDRPAVAAIGSHYLFATHYDNGIKYFYSDGTLSGTVDLEISLPTGPYYFPIATSDDAFYFIGTDESNQFQFCRVDAATSDLQVVATIDAPGPSALPEEGKLFFGVPTVVDNRIFYTDGGALLEYLPLKNKSVRVSPDLGTAGSELEFFGHADQYAWFKQGDVLWQTDGSTTQTRPVVFPSTVLKPQFFSHPQTIDGKLIFEGLANTFPGPAEFGRWSVDPQTGEAIRLNVSDTIAVSEIVTLPNGKFQIRSDGTKHRVFLISNDLTSEQPVADITKQAAEYDVEFTKIDNRALFVTDGELWQTDGTAVGTFRLRTQSDSDIVVGDLHTDKNGNVLLITVSRQIYRVDVGSSVPTYLGSVSNVGLWSDLSTSTFLPIGDGIVFAGVSIGGSFKDKNLWFSNGNETRLLRDITNGLEDVTPRLLGKVGDNVIFASGNERLGYSLWATDGTADKTIRILHTQRGNGFSIAPNTVSQTPDGKLLVSFFDEEFGTEIWITDGTATGTELFSDIATGANNSDPRFSFFGNRVLAFASTTAFGSNEPFVADYGLFAPTQPTSSYKAIVDENQAGAFLGNVQLSDIPSNAVLGFRLHDSSVSDRYSISSTTGALRLQSAFAFNYEAEQTASVIVDVDYRDPFTQEVVTRQVTVEIQIVNQIETPIIQDQIFEVDENLDLAEFIGKISVTAERDSTIQFLRTGGWPFIIDPTSGRFYVQDPSIMNYELHRSLDFFVNATDSQNALSSSAKITVRLRDVDEFPVLTSQLAPTPRTIFSGSVSSIQFDAATFVDPEGQSLTYRVTKSDGTALPSWLVFDPSTRTLTATPAQSDIGVYALRLGASDSNGHESFVPLQITVLDGQFPWYNAVAPLDVNRDGKVSPLDALLVINRLNQTTQRTLPSTNPQASFFYDTNRNGSVSPIDALLIINQLNNRSRGTGEGEQVNYLSEAAFSDIDQTLASMFSSEDIERKRRTL